MQTVSTKAQKINDKIQAITRDRSTVVSIYTLTDDSVQAELRLRINWSITFPVDTITWPQNLAKDNNPLWISISNIQGQINKTAQLSTGSTLSTLSIKSTTKSGPEKRATAKAEFQVNAGQSFLAEHKKATSKKTLDLIRKKIVELQAQQKDLLPQLRKANSNFLAERKSAKAESAARQAESLAAGRFWECTEDTLKDYFHPPFSRNYLADLSSEWRAALYTEMKSTAYKGYSGDWRHKNIGTGWAYLCGIDDNGDEWGHRVNLREYMDHDKYGDMGYMATVEDAMSELFDIPRNQLANCQRQGDLLFCQKGIPAYDRYVCPQCHSTWDAVSDMGHEYCENCGWGDGPHKIPAVTLHPQEGPWEVRESHRIESPSLERNGRWFRSSDKITVTHTSHQPVELLPGEYCLYTLQIPDAD